MSARTAVPGSGSRPHSALGPEPVLMRARHLGAVDAPGEVAGPNRRNPIQISPFPPQPRWSRQYLSHALLKGPAEANRPDDPNLSSGRFAGLARSFSLATPLKHQNDLTEAEQSRGFRSSAVCSKRRSGQSGMLKLCWTARRERADRDSPTAAPHEKGPPAALTGLLRMQTVQWGWNA
jgi:hypothetical protein